MKKTYYNFLMLKILINNNYYLEILDYSDT